MSMKDRYENDINETTFLKSNDDENLTKNPYEDKQRQSEPTRNETGLAYKLRNYLGYIFAILTAINFTIANILVKKAPLLNGADQLTCLFILKTILMFIVMKVKHVEVFGPPGLRIFLSIRGLVGVLGLIFLYSGLIFLPPSDCSAIANSAIIITAILARIFLNEKLGFTHMIAILLTIVGVVFISKPSIFFPRKPMAAMMASELNMEGLMSMDNKSLPIISNEGEGPFTQISSLMLNETLNNQTIASSQTGMFNMDPQKIFIIGIVLALLAALFFGILQIIMKKLCNINVHWSVSTIYAAYVGLPICIALQFILYFVGFSHQNLSQEMPYLPVQVLFSFFSAVFAILGQVCLNISLNYEDPAKVSIAKTTDVFFTFILQYIFLRIQVDIFSILGSVSILLGCVIVLAMKLVEKKLESSKPGESRSCCVSCLLKKF